MDEEKSIKKLLHENQKLHKQINGLKSTEASRDLIEAGLRESLEQYKRLLESITDYIYIYTVNVDNGRPVSTVHGSGCLAVTGYTQEDFQTHPNLWCEMIHNDDREEVIK